jgi:cytochrome P450
MLNGKSMVSLLTTREEERVTALKKHINYTFTAKAVSDFEHQVDATIRSLNSRIAASMPTVDLNRWIRLYTFETICQIAFSDDNLSEADLKEILIGIWERFDHWNRWFTLPGWEKLIYRGQFRRTDGGPSKLVQKAVAIIKEREGSGGISEQGDLLDRYIEANQKIPAELETSVISLVLSTINAGAETTGATIVNTLYFLLSNPSAYAALLRELDAANLESPPTFKSVSQLPYLEATIKETMRLNSVTAYPLEREVPAGGAQIAGYHIPAGVAVAVNERALARSEVWGEEPEAFRPERWLDADHAQRMKMERAWLGFGQGKRMCIGRHIAWMEMKKALPELLLNYKVKSTAVSPLFSRAEPC